MEGHGISMHIHEEISYMIADTKDVSTSDLDIVYKAKCIKVHKDIKILIKANRKNRWHNLNLILCKYISKFCTCELIHGQSRGENGVCRLS